MGKTIAEKILSRASGSTTVVPGECVVVRPSVLVMGDNPVPSFLRQVKVWDPDRIVFIFDHFARLNTTGHAQVREFCREQGIAHLYDVGRHGLTHQVSAEEGFALPGTVYANSDTMAPTVGALGCLAIPCANDSMGVAALGEMWLRVPESVRIELTGRLALGTTTRDLFAAVMRDIGYSASSCVLEFTGPAIADLSIDSRMALCNGAAVIGAMTAIINPDARTIEYVRPRAREPFDPLTSDADARYARTLHYELSDIEPLVSAPPSPEHVRPLSEVRGVAVDQAYIGSCAGGRIEDLRMAVQVLRGRRPHPRVRLIVTPISTHVFEQAMAEGLIASLTMSGATITMPGCGACWSGNDSPGLLGPGEVCITSSPENVPGRMGSPDSDVYIASPAIVAASALEGKIADPRPYLEG